MNWVFVAILVAAALHVLKEAWLGLAWLIRRRRSGPRLLMLLPLLVVAACVGPSLSLPMSANPSPNAAPAMKTGSTGAVRRTTAACPPDVVVPPGKVLFLAYNFTRATWDVTFDPYTLRVPGYQPGEGYAVASLTFQPGTYRWQAQTPDDDGAFISDPEGDVALEFTVEPGDLLFARLMSLSPATSTLRWVVEPEISHCERGAALLDAEDARLRALAAAGDETALAEALDRSTVFIPAGEFTMGSEAGRDDERPAHRVYLDAYELDRYEVTNAQYRRFLLANGGRPPQYWIGSAYPAGQADYPVVGVSWEDADAYCRWAGKRLPTEAEWEKACRGADGRVYPWGDAWAPGRANVDAVGWRFGGATADADVETVWQAAWRRLTLPPGSAGPTLQPVGSHPDGANPYGILDMVGNASEWVADWYNWSDYSKLPPRNPLVTGPPWNHCLRGSPWYDPVGTPAWTQTLSRCSARNSSHEVSDPRVGFRCARPGRI